MRGKSRIGIGVLTFVCMVLIAVVPSFVILPQLGTTLRSVTHRQAEATLQTAANGLALELGRNLQEQWTGVQRLGRYAAEDDDLPRFRQRLDTIVETLPLFAWVGLADTGGRVLVASNGLLEGQDIAARAWFRSGLTGPFAGDMREALLLQQFIRTASGEPLRLIDFSLPVRRANGVPVGVFGAHVRWSAVSDLVRGSARPDGIELFLVSRNGTVLAGATSLEGRQLGLRAVMAAEQGVARATVEAWPDGKEYLTVASPTLGMPDVPSFGWSIVARQPAEVALGATRGVAGSLLPLAAASGLFIVVLAWLFGWWISRPMNRLAEAAAEMVDGTRKRPVPDERLYAEAAALSASLSKLESRIAERAAP